MLVHPPNLETLYKTIQIPESLRYEQHGTIADLNDCQRYTSIHVLCKVSIIQVTYIRR